MLYDIILSYVSWPVTVSSDVTDVWQCDIVTLTLTSGSKNRKMKINWKETENENENGNK